MTLENQYVKILEWEFREIIKAEISGHSPSKIRIFEILEDYKNHIISAIADNNNISNVLYLLKTDNSLIKSIEKEEQRLKRIDRQLKRKIIKNQTYETRTRNP